MKSTFKKEQLSQAIKDKMNYGDSLRTIAPQIGISISTLSRILNNKDAKLVNILKCTDWLGKTIIEYTEVTGYYSKEEMDYVDALAEFLPEY